MCVCARPEDPLSVVSSMMVGESRGVERKMGRGGEMGRERVEV